MIPEAELEVFRELQDIKVVFDVGARDDLEMYEIKPDCEYHLFEPHIEFIGELKAKLRKIRGEGRVCNITLNEFGLSDQEGEAVYYEQIQSCVYRKFGWKMDERVYPLKTLDWYCQVKSIKQIDFLKIDAEGFDYQILLGGKETLKNTKYVQVEWGNVRRLTEVLTDFSLFLMMEPELDKHFAQRGLETKPLMPLDDKLIDLLDFVVSPTGAGGNLLGIRK